MCRLRPPATPNAWMHPVIVTQAVVDDLQRQGADLGRQRGEQPVLRQRLRLLGVLPQQQLGGNASPQPLLVATSTDGGNTWTQKQVTSASNNPFNTKQGFGRSGCTVRTDSHGVVYVFANQFAVGSPGPGLAHPDQVLRRRQDLDAAAEHRPGRRHLLLVQFDGTGFRCVMDGVGRRPRRPLVGPERRHRQRRADRSRRHQRDPAHLGRRPRRRSTTSTCS